MSDSVAIQHCIKKLDRARDALKDLVEATDFAKAEKAWTDLLLAVSGFYAKLATAKKDGPAKVWFAKVKEERRTDALLSYIHHARNSDEHGLEDTTMRVAGGSATFGFREPYDPDKLEGKSFRVGKDIRGHVRIDQFDPEVFEVKHYEKPTLVLVAVKHSHERGKMVPPPTEHLGSKLEDQSPPAVGAKAVAYLESLLVEARNAGL